jgi:hypothetical protein
MGILRWLACACLVLGCAVGCDDDSPTSDGLGKPEDEIETNCESRAFDEEGFGPSPRAALEELPKQVEVPLFWLSAGIDDGLYSREASDASATTMLKLTVEYDGARESTECTKARKGRQPYASMLQVPLTVSVSTDDGASAQFAVVLYRETGNGPTVPTFETPSELRMQWWPELQILQGRILDADKGLGVFPTVCGGVEQASPDESRFGATSSPAWLLKSLSEPMQVTNPDDPDMPALNITLATRDPTACYEYKSSFALDVDLTVETGDLRISGTAPAYVAAGFNGEPATEDSQWYVVWDEFCGDASSSSDWQKYNELDSDQLCVSGEVQMWSGPTAVGAELRWKGATQGWTFWNNVSTVPKD